MKIYEYGDLLVQVPAGITHLMIDEDGVLRGFRSRPDTSLTRPWEAVESIIPGVLNWEKSLCDINTLREYSPVIIHEIAPSGTSRFQVGDKYTLHATVNEELCLTSKVHVVVTCYTPGMKPWCQVLKLKVEGLSIDNILMATVKEIIHDLKVAN